jgi:hypothetical protein
MYYQTLPKMYSVYNYYRLPTKFTYKLARREWWHGIIVHAVVAYCLNFLYCMEVGRFPCESVDIGY